MLDLERKSVEPMALALEGGTSKPCSSSSVWVAGTTTPLEQHQRLVAETLGDAATGVLILDGCDFPKQGGHSVGVARLWCGALGKVANCQASVVAAYAAEQGYTLVDRRLYLPSGGGARRTRSAGRRAAFRTRRRFAPSRNWRES